MENANGKSRKELQQLLLNIGSKRTISMISNRMYKLGLKSNSNAGHFKKGHKAHNKGKKWDEYMSKESQQNSRKTTFKKGYTPANHRQLWEERLTGDGYTEIKIKEPSKWMLKHRYIYEKHYGKIPDGYSIMFADQNKQNFDINNLILVSRAENLIMNHNKLVFDNDELTKSGHLVAKIIDKTNKLKN